MPDLYMLILLPVGLGLLGFVEPCTIGAHLLFLKSLKGAAQRRQGIVTFILVRALAMGVIGLGFALVGRVLVGFQTGLWLAFGLAYMAIGTGYLAGWHNRLARRLSLAPARWRQVRNPAVLGLAFALNIPACAAPLIFGLFTFSAGTASLASGFVMLAVFGLALSLPLLALDAFSGKAPMRLVALKPGKAAMRRILGGVFILLGLWSVWFGLYVDPANWAGSAGRV
ncbi:MAG: cytochrome c biogenesis protein CcdA [Paracoccaceae bacterium]|nr:cytochrome c biogenesis protein CcdA [Paracoccaceae bacterium]